MNKPPPTTTTYQSEPGGGPADPTVGRFVFLFMTGIVILLITMFGRGEVSRWYQARCELAITEQRYEDAVTAANKALEWDSTNEDIVSLRAVARQRNEDYEGCLADFDELIAKAAEDGEKNQRDISLLAEKARVLQKIGRHTEVLAIWEDIIDYRKEEFRQRDDHDSRYDYAMALNNRAYMLAQAYAETRDDSLYDVKQGLEQSRESIKVRRVDDDAVILDTLGYLLLFNGQPQKAVDTLEKVVELTKEEHKNTRALYTRMREKLGDQQVQKALVALDQQYAIILHHRGEAYAAIGEEEKSKADIKEAERLGYDPAKGIW